MIASALIEILTSLYVTCALPSVLCTKGTIKSIEENIVTNIKSRDERKKSGVPLHPKMGLPDVTPCTVAPHEVNVCIVAFPIFATLPTTYIWRVLTS